MSGVIQNLKKGKKLFLGVGIAIFVLDKYFTNVQLKNHIYGADGNGGKMLDIYTYLTDQEIAHLRLERRMKWHSNKLEKDQFKKVSPYILDEELRDLGINFPPDRSVEYNKRPPHDFYI